MKTLALIARRSDHDRAAFRKHYEEIHSPLAMATIMQGCIRYVRHHLRRELHGEAFFDVVTAFQYRDAAAAQALFARSQAPVGAAIRADEQTFMDTARNTFFVVEEEPVSGAEDRSKTLQAVALVRRADQISNEDFQREYLQRWLPALQDSLEGMGWCLNNRAQAGGGARPAYDCVTQLHADGEGSMAAWALELEGAGHQVLLAAVSEHETEIDA